MLKSRKTFLFFLKKSLDKFSKIWYYKDRNKDNKNNKRKEVKKMTVYKVFEKVRNDKVCRMTTESIEEAKSHVRYLRACYRRAWMEERIED